MLALGSHSGFSLLPKPQTFRFSPGTTLPNPLVPSKGV